MRHQHKSRLQPAVWLEIEREKGRVTEGRAQRKPEGWESERGEGVRALPLTVIASAPADALLLRLHKLGLNVWDGPIQLSFLPHLASFSFLHSLCVSFSYLAHKQAGLTIRLVLCLRLSRTASLFDSIGRAGERLQLQISREAFRVDFQLQFCNKLINFSLHKLVKPVVHFISF